MFGQQINRLEPAAPVQAYQTYSITSPPDLTVRSACEEVLCDAWQFGWQTQVDEATSLGKSQADYIRQHSGRTFREQRTGAGLTVFTFDSRQRCFAEHRTRPEAYRVRHGDWRGNPDGYTRTHQRPADWVEDMNETLHRVQESQERG